MKINSLPPVVTQITGLVMAVFFVIFWAVTGRIEPLLLGFSLTLISIGTVSQARAGLKELEDKEPDA